MAKAKALSKSLSLDERQAVKIAVISGKVSDVEDRYRKALDAAGAFACGRAMLVFVFAPLGGGRPSAEGAADLESVADRRFGRHGRERSHF